MSFVSPTYAKVGGYTPMENVGAPTFLIFPLIFRAFLGMRLGGGRVEGLAFGEDVVGDPPEFAD
jgi:hypothetical protein